MEERDKHVMLSRFMKMTQLDLGFAHDLLEGTNWNFDAAVRDFQELQGQKRLSAQRQAAPKKISPKENPSNQIPPKTSPKPSSPQRSPPQKGSPKRNSPPNGQMTQPIPNRASPKINGRGDDSISHNGGSSSPNALQHPQLRDPPKSPGTKRLTRGLSAANSRLVITSRQRVKDDEESHNYQLVDTPRFTFILPDLLVFPADFRAFVEKDLIDSCTMVNLENSGYLNWWAKTGACSKLWPMATTGDGNCLLHAASLGMWGFHDRQLTLRKALYKDLSDHQHTAHMQKLKRRWRWQQTLANKESGLVYSEEEWEEEWKSLLKLASTIPRNHKFKNNGGKPMGGGPLPSVAEDQDYLDDDEEIMYESLEEFHVFVLCHILRRPIIIVADTVLRDSQGQPLAPIPFGGIYLPVELHPLECHRSPLVLTYDASHFSALVPMEVDSHRDTELKKQPPVIPITDSNHHLLTLHFIVDPGIGWQWKDENHNDDKTNGIEEDTSLHKLVYSPKDKLKLLQTYLELVRLEIPDVHHQESSSPTQGDEWELLPPKENGMKTVKVEVARSNSSGSEKSDRSGGKEKEKSRSFGKKLKHFAGLDKSKKGSSRKDSHEQFHIIEEKHKKDRTSTEVTIQDVADRSVVVAAKMDDVRLQGVEEMIRNYLESAKTRFHEEVALKRMIAAENRSRQQQRIQREQRPHDVCIDDDERTNEAAYHFASLPRVHVNGPMSSRGNHDYPDNGRGVQYVHATSSNPGSPAMERVNNGTSYNPAAKRQGGTYSPQPVRAHYNPPQPRYQAQTQSPQFQRTVPIQRLHINDRNQEIRSNSNPYATHVRGRRVPIEEEATRQCRTFGCKYFGSEKTDFLCSHCYESIIRKKQPLMR
ncbi:OTU domain-containing protein 7B-like [Lytechinus pictus]|uniref:OTU domain-containing protein 7B-like n=1 Tax=Lytechinus pictus TaxID=7653 RepID=UPI0030B9F2D4